jgi:hypothetical protein
MVGFQEEVVLVVIEDQVPGVLVVVEKEQLIHLHQEQMGKGTQGGVEGGAVLVRRINYQVQAAPASSSSGSVQ